MRILLVEDELEIQRFVKQSLTGAGYEVHTAEDGHTAALLASKHVYHGLIVDLGLPDQDGIDLILHQPGAHPFRQTIRGRPRQGSGTRRR